MDNKNGTRGIGRSYAVIIIFVVIQTLIVSVVFYGITRKYASTINVNTYKSALDSRLSVIYCTYNSGKTNFSFLWELKNIFSSLTGIDSNNPISILNQKNPAIKKYYPIYLSNLKPPEEEDHIDKPGDPDIDYTGEKYVVFRCSENNALSISYEVDDTYHDESSIEYNGEDDGTYAKGSVVIKNGSGLNIDIEKIINQPFYKKFDGSGGPQILIYHTHTTEGYIRNLQEFDDKSVSSFSTDNTRNVVRAGHELDVLLSGQYGFKTIHNSTQHHYPSSQAYSNSLKTIQNVVKGNPSVKLSIDIHRDGLSLDQGKLRLTQKVNGKDCAKIMFVVGTDATGSNPGWEDNLRLAILLQEKLETIAPGLTRHISIRSGRYNQQVCENALLMEFGGDGNTIDEIKESCKYVAEAMNYVLGDAKTK